MHEVEVDIVGLEVLQGRSNAFRDFLVPWVVQLGGDPDLATGDTRIDDALSDFSFVAISKSTSMSVCNIASEDQHTCQYVGSHSGEQP